VKRQSRYGLVAGFTAILSFVWGTTLAQLTVEDFPELALTDWSYVSQERVDAFQDEALQISIEPFKIFDNFYYVGLEWVASYLLVTSDGLILIDTLHDPYVEVGAEYIRQLGFDPADIRYVLGTHGHFDHMGGHAYYQQNFGARAGLTAADWKRAGTDSAHPVFGTEMAEVDWVIQDGESLTLGDQTMKFYVTPGHTEGVLSMEFTVRDGDNSYRAVIFGGGGAQGANYWRNQMVLGNIRRFQALASQSPQFQVRFAGHPSGPGGIAGQSFFDLGKELVGRRPSDRHPFVEDASAFIEYLQQAEQNVERTILSQP
jgi:metallo-beta-lactamase class B